MVKRSNKLPLDEKPNNDLAAGFDFGFGSIRLNKILPQGFVIRDLKDRVDCLDEVALWHHHEWLRTSDQAIDVTTFGDQLDQRVELLKSHIAESGIPFTLIAELSGEVVGTVSVVQYTFAKAKNPSDWLTNLFVLPEWREKNIGSHLLGCAENLAEKYGIKVLKLYTHDKNEFYQKHQWQVMGGARIQQRDVTILSKTLG